jgi:hypothetical protein
MNDDRSPLLTLISCITCKKTMRLEKLSPADDGKDVIQYRCERCGRIERVHLVRGTWPLERRSKAGGLISVRRGPLPDSQPSSHPVTRPNWRRRARELDKGPSFSGAMLCGYSAVVSVSSFVIKAPSALPLAFRL